MIQIDNVLLQLQRVECSTAEGMHSSPPLPLMPVQWQELLPKEEKIM